MNTAPLVIFAYGNPSRGDDALGPALLHQLDPLKTAEIELIEDFQLQVEHALDLVERDLALFIDASVSCPPPFQFTRLSAHKDYSYTSHALHPSALLYVFAEIQQRPPPPTFLLTLRGEAFELGAPLSVAAQAHLQAAFEFVQQLVNQIELAAWQQWAIPPATNPVDS
ncbi:MAG: hydrogenase maturation protease [Pseudomonadota bacterium]|nr:hydrogenase maturation protease [Pseudomonadota bacterium]